VNALLLQLIVQRLRRTRCRQIKRN
jgi:hypothetical protein